MSYDFKEVMKNKTDKELLKALEKKEDYQPDAIKAAEEEIKSRGTKKPKINEEKKKDLKEKIEKTEKIEKKSLGLNYKVASIDISAKIAITIIAVISSLMMNWEVLQGAFNQRFSGAERVVGKVFSTLPSIAIAFLIYYIARGKLGHDQKANKYKVIKGFVITAIIFGLMILTQSYDYS